MLSALYPWVKALHVIAVIAWMAGLLYLPRLFVYHCGVEAGSAASELFKVMEWRLQRAIMTPAMIATFLFGALLLATPGVVDWSAAWIYFKLTLVALLTVMHHLMVRWRGDFAADRNRHSARFFRIVNELPTALMIGIVIFVVVKPI